MTRGTVTFTIPVSFPGASSVVSPSLRARLAEVAARERRRQDVVLRAALSRHGVEREPGEDDDAFAVRARALLHRLGHRLEVGDVCLVCSCGWYGSGPWAMHDHAVSVLRSAAPAEAAP